MQQRILPILLVVFLAACATAAPSPASTPTFRFPSTWTPAPSPTNTPPGPTATLVVQRTPGPPATRDPNARLLPTLPRSTIGIWIDVAGARPQDLTGDLSRAQVIVTDGATFFQRPPGAFILNVGKSDDKISGGFILTTTVGLDASAVAQQREQIKPRVVLVQTPVSDTLHIPSLGADGVVLTHFLHDPGTPTNRWRTPGSWLRDLNALATFSANPNTVVLTSTAFGVKDLDGSVARAQWYDYALSSFLLGVSNPHTYFGFQWQPDQRVNGSPALNAALGSPVGGYFTANGVYQRRFDHGLVLVNPTDANHAFALSRNYKKLDGTPTAEAALPAHSGLILLLATP